VSPVEFFDGRAVTVFNVTAAGLSADIFVSHPEMSEKKSVREINLRLFSVLRENLSFWLGLDPKITISRLDAVPKGWPAASDAYVYFLRSGETVLVRPEADYFSAILAKETGGNGDAAAVEGCERAFRRLALRTIRTLDVGFGLILEKLTNRDVQLLMNVLLREKKMEETMLAGLIQAHPESSNLITANLSKNVREEVERLGKFPGLWGRQSTWLIRHAVVELWREGLLDIPLLNSFQEFLDHHSLALYRERFSGRALEELSRSDPEGSWFAGLCRDFPSITLARAFRDAAGGLIERLEKAMVSDRQRQTFEEDLKFSREKEGEDEHGRRVVVDYLLARLVDGEMADKRISFAGVLMELDTVDLNDVVSDTGTVRFAKACHDLQKDQKDAILNKVDFLPRTILRDLFTGRTRFKEAVSEDDIRDCRAAILKFIWSSRKLGLFRVS